MLFNASGASDVLIAGSLVNAPIFICVILGLPGNVLTLSITVRQLYFKVVRGYVHEIYLCELACIDTILLLFWFTDTVINNRTDRFNWWSPPLDQNISWAVFTSQLYIDGHKPIRQPVFSCHCISFVMRIFVELRCWLLVIFIIQRCCDGGTPNTNRLLNNPTKPERLNNNHNDYLMHPSNRSPLVTSVSSVPNRFTLHSAISNLIGCFLISGLLVLKNLYTYLYLIRYLSPTNVNYTIIYECIFTAGNYLNNTKFIDDNTFRNVKAISDGLGVFLPYLISLICAFRTISVLVINSAACQRLGRSLAQSRAMVKSAAILGNNVLFSTPTPTTTLTNTNKRKQRIQRQKAIKKSFRRDTVLSLSAVFLLSYGPYASMHTWLKYVIPDHIFIHLQYPLYRIAIKMMCFNHILLFYMCLLTDRHFRFDVTQILCFCCCINKCRGGGVETHSSSSKRKTQKTQKIKHFPFRRRTRTSVAYFYRNWQEMVQSATTTVSNNDNEKKKGEFLEVVEEKKHLVKQQLTKQNSMNQSNDEIDESDLVTQNHYNCIRLTSLDDFLHFIL